MIILFTSNQFLLQTSKIAVTYRIKSKYVTSWNYINIFHYLECVTDLSVLLFYTTSAAMLDYINDNIAFTSLRIYQFILFNLIQIYLVIYLVVYERYFYFHIIFYYCLKLSNVVDRRAKYGSLSFKVLFLTIAILFSPHEQFIMQTANAWTQQERKLHQTNSMRYF